MKTGILNLQTGFDDFKAVGKTTRKGFFTYKYILYNLAFHGRNGLSQRCGKPRPGTQEMAEQQIG